MTATGLLTASISTRLDATLDLARQARLPAPAQIRLRRASDHLQTSGDSPDLIEAIREATLGARTTGEPETGRLAKARTEAEAHALPRSSDPELETAAQTLRLLSILDEALVLRISWMAHYSQAPTEQP